MTLHVESWVGGPLSNNIYLLWDESALAAVLIDPSIGSEPALLRLHELEENGVHLQAIWNTHGHFDHIYDNAKWKQEYSVPLMMHKDDCFLIEFLHDQSLWFGLEAPESTEPDADLSPTRELKVGNYTAQVLHTPGHSPGSVSFWFESENVCVSGDVLFAGSVGRTDLPGCSAQDLGHSLQKLLALPPQTRILPGHGPATTVGQEMTSNSLCRKLIQKARQ
jgi:glyoxylase-like metal-dependent hydrolase (beta-lactamase superfamily II)